ncbi:sigma-70 family RNA polymerase sigma factor [Luteolibacter sp. GHJ8]|uniref:Sigma-70 family RNA polymerase sigma factor n=1 Tax=Luteolibacter rhizosphaerae TaxID=2989719 RepID=A0ABT3G504_9BACT|nr:sigma-70 family RNA polymerase sigma factor [Luteolibacter rhizosphaerae]MCW1914564.1 sigma-70 family RNA polymerase sigma factor [Luteolibacter rhizosphaerae]
MSAPPVHNPEVPKLTEHLFRHEAAKLVSTLTGIFGIHRLQLAEDVVQEAMIRALQTWPYYGVPANPAAWLMQTAKNRALDLIRREKLFNEKQLEIAASLEALPDEGDTPRFDDEIRDDRLRLIFACCHPAISLEDQTVLALKTLCAFSVTEIATAFLSSEGAIAKRLTRAKQRIQDQRIPFEIPSGAELESRLDGVLQVLYLLFNEGYKASSGELIVKEDLCREAIRLGGLLAAHPAADHPRTHALLALMLLDAARIPARQDRDGNILRLMDQDRESWDRTLIAAGLWHLSQSSRGEELSEYHLQAGIAACHCTAADYRATDWARILKHYDRWQEVSDSPVVALNRAVAVANVHGAEAGMKALREIAKPEQLETYYLFHAVVGDFEERMERRQEAAASFSKAIELTGVAAEKTFLDERRRACESNVPYRPGKHRPKG